MSSVTGFEFNCEGASVWGPTEYPYVEFDVVDLTTLEPLAAVEVEPHGYYGASVQFAADPDHAITGVVRTYNVLHLLIETIPVFLADSCSEGSMANIDCTVEYQIEDDNGLVNPLTLYAIIPDAKTLANIQTGLNVLTPLVAAVVDGGTPKINLTLHMAVVSGNASPTAECNNNETGNITLSVTGIKYPTTINIPSFKDSLAVQGQIANSGATATLVTELLATTGTWCTFTDKYLNAVAAFLRGRTSFRGNRKQLARAASGRHNA